MHGLAPSCRVAFGLGETRAVGAAGEAEALQRLPAESRDFVAGGAGALLGEAAAAGGGCCCWRRLRLLVDARCVRRRAAAGRLLLAEGDSDELLPWEAARSVYRMASSVSRLWAAP